MLFGLLYSGTVATYPKAIFAVASGILVGVLMFLNLVRPAEVAAKGKRRMKKWEREEAARGRSRVSKDLRGGSAGMGLGMPRVPSMMVGQGVGRS
jgi:hypothetical protein